MSYIKERPVAVGHLGVPYIDFLRMAAAVLKPKSYFEIGTETGATMTEFACDTVCVDPKFTLQVDPIGAKRRAMLFQMTSDEFFAENDLRDIFPDGVDVALLDGLHRFEYLLRDFMNTERACRKDSVLFLHDCMPTDPAIAERYAPVNQIWTGDVWKMLFILEQYRPELRVFAFDCSPTGLIVCTNLNPHTNALHDSHYKILDEYGDKKLDKETMTALWQLYPVVDTKALSKRPHDLNMLL